MAKYKKAGNFPAFFFARRRGLKYTAGCGKIKRKNAGGAAKGTGAIFMQWTAGQQAAIEARNSALAKEHMYEHLNHTMEKTSMLNYAADMEKRQLTSQQEP